MAKITEPIALDSTLTSVKDQLVALNANLSIAHGPKGDTGPQGPQGPQGEAGKGVAVGGVTNQVLMKNSNDDYDTKWGTIDLSSKQDTLVSGTNIKTLNNESLLGPGNIDINSAQWGNISGTLSNQTDLNTVLSGKEDTANKITSIDESSTDEQYPSAKSVYTGLAGKENADATILKQSDVVNNLTTTSDNKPLSALQGKNLDVAKENITNKVTSLSSSATDQQYPSAKCVYDSLKNVLDLNLVWSDGTSTTKSIYEKV